MYEESDRRYYQSHRDEILMKRKERHIKNRERDALLAKRYVQEHKNESDAYKRQYSKSHRPEMREYHRKRYAAHKKLFLKMYGDKCECCGEAEPEFLTLDHIHGQTKETREYSNVAYKNAVKEHQPDVYRILCMNCNMAVRWGRTCPHQIS